MSDDASHLRSTELIELIRSRSLRYPIGRKEDFVQQMKEAASVVEFRGRVYETDFAANLVPEFFFPVESEEDLVGKTTELLVSRGLLPAV